MRLEALKLLAHAIPGDAVELGRPLQQQRLLLWRTRDAEIAANGPAKMDGRAATCIGKAGAP